MNFLRSELELLPLPGDPDAGDGDESPDGRVFDVAAVEGSPDDDPEFEAADGLGADCCCDATCLGCVNSMP